MTKTYPIEVDCANCAARMETAVAALPGVQSAVVNFIAQKLKLTFAPGADIPAVQSQILSACKKVEPDCEIFF